MDNHQTQLVPPTRSPSFFCLFMDMLRLSYSPPYLVLLPLRLLQLQEAKTEGQLRVYIYACNEWMVMFPYITRA